MLRWITGWATQSAATRVAGVGTGYGKAKLQHDASFGPGDFKLDIIGGKAWFTPTQAQPEDEIVDWF